MFTDQLIYNDENISPNHVTILPNIADNATATTKTASTISNELSNKKTASNTTFQTIKANNKSNKGNGKKYLRNPFKKRIILKDVTTEANNNRNNTEECTTPTTRTKKVKQISDSKPNNIIDYAEQSLSRNLESNTSDNISHVSSLYKTKSKEVQHVTKKVLSSTKRRLLQQKKNSFKKTCIDLNETTQALSRVALGISKQNCNNTSTATTRPVSYSISGSMVYRNLEKQGIIGSSPSSTAERTKSTASVTNTFYNSTHHIMSTSNSQDDLESLCSTLPSCTSWFQKMKE